MIKKQAPFPAVEKIEANMQFFNSVPENLKHEVVRMENDQKSSFLLGRIKQLESLMLTEEPAISKVDSIRKELYYNYPQYVIEQIDLQLHRKNVSDLDWLNKTKNIISSFQDYVKNAHSYYKKQLRDITTGIRGEERVEKELELMKAYCTYLSNVRLEVDGNSVESDFIVFSPKGIFILEVKNFAERGQYKLKITKDGQWKQVYPNGNEIPRPDVQAQNNRHVFLKEEFVRTEWEKYYGEAPPQLKFHSVIIIANDKVEIENETNLPIMRISQIPFHMEKFRDNLSQEILEKVQNIIRSNQLPPKKYPVKDYTKSIKEFREKVDILEEHGQKLKHIYDDFLVQIKDNMN